MSKRRVIDFWIGPTTGEKRYLVANELDEVYHKYNLHLVTKHQLITQSILDGLIIYNVNPKNNLYYFAGSAKYFQQKTVV